LDRRRKIARNRRAKIVTASAAAKKGGDEDEDGEGGEGEPSTSSSSDAQKQPDLATLRAKLDAAIEAEDYALAASLRDALRALEDDAVAGVAEANARFYAAFRAADIDVMASCLGFGDNVTVIHPGCNAIRGREAVLESWRVIFSGATRAAGKGAVVALDIEAVEVQVYAPPTAAAPKGSDSSADYSASPSKSDNNSKGTGALGVVTCVERVDGGDATGRVVATNVFERGGDGRYRMILHHGSSAPPLRRKG
jgi:ketosteroid isomerase-like protein